MCAVKHIKTETITALSETILNFDTFDILREANKSQLLKIPASLNTLLNLRRVIRRV